MRISDWSSDVCSSDLKRRPLPPFRPPPPDLQGRHAPGVNDASDAELGWSENRPEQSGRFMAHARGRLQCLASSSLRRSFCFLSCRSEEHTSELQSLMRISYAVFCLKKKKTKNSYTCSHKITTH